jgi:hypothetical protein
MTPGKRTLQVLSLLLVAQVGLAVAFNMEANRYGSFHSDTPVLAFDIGTVDGLVIEDDGGHTVQLLKRDGHWILPQADNFPAAAGRVDALLMRLAALKVTWPVASTSSAAKRLKVAEHDFERHLTLRHGDKILAGLYTGTSPGFRKVNARADGEDEIYSVGLESLEMPAEPAAWEDRQLLTLKAEDITRVELPGVVLQREGDELQVAPLGNGELTAATESRTLLQRIANLTYSASAGKSGSAAADNKAADFEFSLTRKSGERRDYHFTRSSGGSDYVLTVSDQPWSFRVPAATLDGIRSETRSKLVTAPGAAQQGTEKKASGVDTKASS